MKIHLEQFLGARALARFNARNDESLEITGVSSLPEWKRRERRAPGRGEDGSVVFLFIALLAIMMILVTAESRALAHLHREVKMLEQQQIKRLNPAPTNTVAVIKLEPK